MSAGQLAKKLLLKPKDLTTARAIRPKDGSGVGSPGGGGTGGDFGDFTVAPEVISGSNATAESGWEDVPGREPFPLFFHEESAAEQLVSAKDTAATTYVGWSLLDANGEPPVSEDEHLEVSGEGRVNVTGVVRRPTENLARIDAKKVG